MNFHITGIQCLLRINFVGDCEGVRDRDFITGHSVFMITSSFPRLSSGPTVFPYVSELVLPDTDTTFPRNNSDRCI
jgi:hypothetical protein